ncbi:IS1380 family insertion sequence transposase domain-containing protein (plasmid) [Rhizobium sp. CIAT894]|nr:IS1380 family insertion sequence transposase domain-containing protein [Rhizobium sp. CIAT894]
MEAHRQASQQITPDVEATDDPIHGNQEGRFFHGYYDSYPYLPLYILCGWHLLLSKLRRANIGAVEAVKRTVGQIRSNWPRIRILLGADSGFFRETLMAWCEANKVDYLFGLARAMLVFARRYGVGCAVFAICRTRGDAAAKAGRRLGGVLN